MRGQQFCEQFPIEEPRVWTLWSTCSSTDVSADVSADVQLRLIFGSFPGFVHCWLITDSFLSSRATAIHHKFICFVSVKSCTTNVRHFYDFPSYPLKMRGYDKETCTSTVWSFFIFHPEIPVLFNGHLQKNAPETSLISQSHYVEYFRKKSLDSQTD